jgi:ribosomal protein S18 acetylase RimI-like enzyme
MEPVLLRDAEPADAPALAALAALAFRETFGTNYPPEDLETFLASAYALPKIVNELKDPAYRCFVTEDDEGLAGYALLHEGAVESCVTAPDPIELERIYVLRRALGSGLGQRLLDHCVTSAAASGRRALWLGVWEHNLRAQAFYLRNGFEEVGSHLFRVGNTEDRDLIFQKRLA